MRTTIVLLLLASAALAHGGRYRGPIWASSAESHLEQWIFWWRHNGDEILDRVGDARRPADDPMLRRLLREVAVPALRRAAVEPEVHPDIRAGALIALARDGWGHDLLLRLASEDEELIVREAAAIGLGVFGDGSEEVRRLLIGIAEEESTHIRLRCFALIALGLLGDGNEATDGCFRRALDRIDTSIDLRVSALFAVGLSGDRTLLEDLTAVADERRGEDLGRAAVVRAHAVAAIGALGDPRGIGTVLEALRTDETPVRRAAASAFGRLLPRAAGVVRRVSLDHLLHRLPEEPDTLTYCLMLIALGRIAAASPELLPDCLVTLRVALERGDARWPGSAAPPRSRRGPNSSDAHVKSYAALGLGLAAHGLDKALPAEAAMRAEIAGTIRTPLAKLRGDKAALGGYAIALGLAGDRDPAAGKLLREILADRGQDRTLRGAAAISLALIGDPAGREPVFHALLAREDRDIRIDTALAAGLFGGPDTVPLLVRALRDPKASQFVLGSAAQGFRWTADRRSVGPLITVLEAGEPNGEYPDLTRALAASALGLLLDDGRGHRLRRAATGYPWRSSVAALDEFLTLH